jgi:RNA polymerase sigma-70 factor (ECF subfamily)
VVGLDEDGHPTTLAATIAESERTSRLGITNQTAQDRLEMRLDVESAKHNLPAPLADLCERLSHATPAEVAREMGVPPSTLYERIRQIRAKFENDGLASYL